MLQTLLAYGRGAGVDTRWLVLHGDAEFFTITKRIHNPLHGAPGDAVRWGQPSTRFTQGVLAANLAELLELVAPGDMVLLHDPQTAGLVDGIRGSGARVIWRCHIGRDGQRRPTQAWAFLRRYVDDADAFVFSRRELRAGLGGARAAGRDRAVDRPVLDQEPGSDRRRARRAGALGLMAGGDRGRPGRLRAARRHARARCAPRTGPAGRRRQPPPVDAPLVVQVSRWDRLKDMAGVLAGVRRAGRGRSRRRAPVLVGPDVAGVTDDPEGAEVLAECRDLAAAARRGPRAGAPGLIPMDDGDENAIIVNALQRHADVVVQKSLVEGFGLTVTEAMWKGRPVLASAVGGIHDQIVDGATGCCSPTPPTSTPSRSAAAACSTTRARRAAGRGRARARSSTSSSATDTSPSTSTSSRACPGRESGPTPRGVGPVHDRAGLAEASRRTDGGAVVPGVAAPDVSGAAGEEVGDRSVAAAFAVAAALEDVVPVDDP